MHTTGGYLTQVAFTHKYVFDLHADEDIYWCAADIGWVTGHSYIVYGPLTNGATSVMYEGTPDFPDKDRWWSIIERYRVTILYCAPTAIRTFMKWGDAVSRRPRPVDAAPARLGRRADQPRSVGLVLEHDRRRALPRRRHVVADRDRRHHDLAAARAHHAEAGVGHLPAAGHRPPNSSTTRASPSNAAAAISRSPSRGRRCCAASGATPSATRRRTGRASRVATSPATAPSSTTTATCGCSAASTT